MSPLGSNRTRSIEAGAGGSNLASVTAISCKVESATCWPTILPAGVTPMKTWPPLLLRKPQSVCAARLSSAVDLIELQFLGLSASDQTLNVGERHPASPRSPPPHCGRVLSGCETSRSGLAVRKVLREVLIVAVHPLSSAAALSRQPG